MAYRWTPDEDARTAIRRIVLEQADKALADLERPDNPAHAARKRLKKIRAALRLARPGMKGADYARENAAWREAGWLLAPVRDHNARLETIERLRAAINEPLSMAALSTLREHIAASALLDADSALRHGARVIAEARERAGRLKIDPGAADVFAAGLRRAYRRGGERGAAAYESGAAVDFHDWRKSVKTLGLQLRIVSRAAPEELGAFQDQLSDLGDLLGDDHDIAQMRALIARRPDLLDTEDQRDALDARLVERSVMLRAKARPAFEAVYAEKPKAFGQRMEALLAEPARDESEAPAEAMEDA